LYVVALILCTKAISQVSQGGAGWKRRKGLKKVTALVTSWTLQVAHTDVVLDDMWTLDLVKLDGWKCVRENTEGEEPFKEDSDWESADAKDGEDNDDEN